jgi:hypothetical protein
VRASITTKLRESLCFVFFHLNPLSSKSNYKNQFSTILPEIAIKALEIISFCHIFQTRFPKMPRHVLQLSLILALFFGAVLEGRAFVQFAKFVSANATFVSPTATAGAGAATTTAKIASTASKTTAITQKILP